MSRRPFHGLDEDLVVVRGELVSSRVYDDFYTIARFTPAGAVDGATAAFTAVGKMLDVRQGDTVELQGLWEEHPRHGRQFRVRLCTVVVTEDASGAVAWIASRLPDVGRARATELVERFGVPALWTVIEQEPGRLAEVPGITPPPAPA